MKKLLILSIYAGILSSCTGGAYHLTTYEKEGQKGFHANQANKIIDKNEKNRKVNQKAAEKSKQAQNEHLNALNKNKSKGGIANSRSFKFY